MSLDGSTILRDVAVVADESHKLVVDGSIPSPATINVRMPEWSKGMVCKTIIRRFKSDFSLKKDFLEFSNVLGSHFNLK